MTKFMLRLKSSSYSALKEEVLFASQNYFCLIQTDKNIY